MKIIPLQQRVLVEPKKEEEKSFILPETAEQEVNEGIVVAVAADVTIVKVGDRVTWNELAGKEMYPDPKNTQLSYILLPAESLECILQED